MIIERKFGELKDGEKFFKQIGSAEQNKCERVKDCKLEMKNRYSDGEKTEINFSPDTIVYQLITRKEQIAALKAIEKPFSLWPEWLQTCEVFKELKDKEVWDWYSISCRWNCATIFYDDGNLVRLSPTYQDKEPEKPKEPKFTKHTISFELVEGEMKNLKFE